MTASLIRRSITATALTALASLIGGCADDAAPTASNAATPTDAMIEGPAMEAMGAMEAMPDPDLVIAESFIDAFYSFDPERLAPIMAAAEETAPNLLYYQGWAEGGHYEVLERTPCAKDEEGIVKCPVKVKDDPVQALGTGFDVTDTFHLTFQDGVLVEITTSSNDQEIYGQARAWVEEKMPEVMAGPCGPEGTPGDCARAMTAGYAAFVESPEFPGVPPLPAAE